MQGLRQPTAELVESVRRDLPKLNSLRIRAGLTLAQVATELGVSIAAVSRWESGDRYPQGWNASAVRDLLDRLEAAR